MNALPKDLTGLLRSAGAIGDLDAQFARFIGRVCDGDGMTVLSAALVSAAASGQGSSCLDIPGNAGTGLAGLFPDCESLPELCGDVSLPSGEEWIACLRRSRAVGEPGDFKPLILDPAGRLYLRRYWEYERTLAEEVRRRSSTRRWDFDHASLADGLRRHFKDAPSAPDWRKAAALSALTGSFCVIAGGPGTGKTSTVTSVLAILLEQSPSRPPRIALAAPTGKAAARLKEAVRKAKGSLDCDASLKALIPEEASTVHRLLEPLEGSPYFKRGLGNPLPADIIVIDEASMMPLSLMAKLVQAAPVHARLILLGDKDQLASVEAGAVMGDVCAASFDSGFSSRFRDFHKGLTGEELPGTTLDGRLPAAPDGPLADCAVMLRHSYRFHPGRGIGVLSRTVNSGDSAKAVEVMVGDASGEISFRSLPPPKQFAKEIVGTLCGQFGKWSSERRLEDAFKVFESFRLLTPLRRGPYGAGPVNDAVMARLERQGMAPHGAFSKGVPLMILSNDYQLGLFNGDVGMLWPDAAGRMRAHFPSEGGGFRDFTPLRLPLHERAFAMTVHKSQGSEFDEVLLLLPDCGAESSHMTREMLYTGLTRARSRVHIWGSREMAKAMISKVAARSSGLRAALS